MFPIPQYVSQLHLEKPTASHTGSPFIQHIWCVKIRNLATLHFATFDRSIHLTRLFAKKISPFNRGLFAKLIEFFEAWVALSHVFSWWPGDAQVYPARPESHFNGHFGYLTSRYLPYIRHMIQGDVREYVHKIVPYLLSYLRFRILKCPLNIRNLNVACHDI